MQTDRGLRPPRRATCDTPRARIEPLSDARYKVQLTASAALKAKLERACDLMRHRNPSGDLAVVIDAAMDLLLAKLEKERLERTNHPFPRLRHVSVVAPRTTPAKATYADILALPKHVGAVDRDDAVTISGRAL